MKVLWSTQAKRQRRAVWNYIAADNPRAANHMDELFEAAANRLAVHPKMGKIGEIPDTRELIPHKSYRMVYRITEDTIWIVTLIHTAREWLPST
ncbi:MAG: type II toxin-antitoxin system RelE/ParE family toxin [Zoogloeaceae bacterium]|nr:type II toxin-antitoxin system RelE/ParE family toxin [Zoogloeaceae bacterium]